MNFIMENPAIMEDMWWFIIGAVSYRIITTLSGYLELQNFAKKIDRKALLLIGKLMEDVKFGRDIKYTYLKETGMPSATLREIKEKDAKDLTEWKTQTINYFLTSYPRRYLKSIDLVEWGKLVGVKIPMNERENKEN